MSLFIKNGLLVTMDDQRRIIENGAVAVEGDKIVEVGKTARLERKHRAADRVIDARNMAILPGLINTHTHLLQNLLKGISEYEKGIKEWCESVLYPLYRIANLEIIAGNDRIANYGALMAFLEMIRSGTTCFVAMDGPHPGICEAMKKVGIRGFHAIVTDDKWVPEDVRLSVKDQLRFLDKIVTKWHEAENRRIRCMIAPTTIFCLTDEYLRKSLELAENYNLRLSIHVSESSYEVELVQREKGKRPVEFLHDFGLLGPKVLSVHTIWVNDHEIALLKKDQVKVSHNPESNMKAGNGVAPVPKMLKQGIVVSLATDGCGGNDNLDMFESMRTAAFLHKVTALDPTVISARKVLEMATIDAARAIGLEREIGSVEVGKRADLILVNLYKPHFQPLHNVEKGLVYCACGGDVDTVIVDGRVIMDHKEIATVKEGEIIDEARRITYDAMKKAEEYLPYASWRKPHTG